MLGMKLWNKLINVWLVTMHVFKTKQCDSVVCHHCVDERAMKKAGGHERENQDTGAKSLCYKSYTCLWL